MGFYSKVFGKDIDVVKKVMELLSLDEQDFARFRDAYITETHLVVYTRLGALNREYYSYVFDKMKQHKLYDYEQEDTFDKTYLSFYFKHPVELTEQLKEYAKENPTVSPDEGWIAFNDAIDREIADSKKQKAKKKQREKMTIKAEVVRIVEEQLIYDDLMRGKI